MKKIRGILSDYGTLKNCRIMGLVGFWNRTVRNILGTVNFDSNALMQFQAAVRH